MKQRDNWESRVSTRVEQARIHKYRYGFATKEAENTIKNYEKWLKDNNMEPTNKDILLIN